MATVTASSANRRRSAVRRRKLKPAETSECCATCHRIGGRDGVPGQLPALPRMHHKRRPRQQLLQHKGHTRESRRACKKRKAVKAQEEVAKMNKCHRGGGAWQLLGADSDSCQGQSSEGESASSDPPRCTRCDSVESDLVDAVNDDAREEHDLSTLVQIRTRCKVWRLRQFLCVLPVLGRTRMELAHFFRTSARAIRGVS